VARKVNDDFPFFIYHFPFAIGGFNFHVQQSSWLSLQGSEMFIAETARQKELAPEERNWVQLRAQAAKRLLSSGAKQQIKRAPAISISPRWGDEAGKSSIALRLRDSIRQTPYRGSAAFRAERLRLSGSSIYPRGFASVALIKAQP
jgi:hypothetical protein